MSTPSFFRSVADRLDAFMNAPTRRPLLFGAAVAGLLWLATLFFENWMTERIWGPLRLGLRVLASLPMGYAGLALATCLVLAIVLSFADTSPTAAAITAWLRAKGEQQQQAPRSHTDAVEIDRMREMWINKAELACLDLAELLEIVVQWIAANGIPFAILLRRLTISPLRESVKAFGAMLRPDATESLTVVTGELGAVIDNYRNAAAWLNLCVEYDVGKPNTLKEIAQYARWLPRHAAFAQGIDDLRSRTSFGDFKQSIEHDPNSIRLEGHRWGEYVMKAPPRSTDLSKSPLEQPTPSTGAHPSQESAS